MSRPTRPRHRGLRVLVSALASAVLLGTACGAWLVRDPVPRIMERRGALARAAIQTSAPEAAHVNEVVRLEGTSGLKVQLMLRRPADSTGVTSRRSVFLILGGYRTGDRAATLIPDTHGNIVAALAYPYEGDLGMKGLAVIPRVPALRRAILDTPAAIMLAIDHLLLRPDVDSTRIELVGASFGTPFATMAGALDPRASRVWSLHGAAWPYEQIELNLRRSIGFAPARKLVAGLATLLASGPRFDPADWAPRISPRPFIMINARNDERMPREAIDALWAAAKEPKELIWLDGPHMQSNRREVLAGLVEAVLTRAQAR
jgi:dienelactone hydrolase